MEKIEFSRDGNRKKTDPAEDNQGFTGNPCRDAPGQHAGSPAAEKLVTCFGARAVRLCHVPDEQVPIFIGIHTLNYATGRRMGRLCL